ncbi:MAG: hypothetical protein IJ391_04610 [Clostridia bacterium]|nr:hypothetical protein [Clostridia bacterium]
MEFKIIKPSYGEIGYERAVDAFVAMYKSVCARDIGVIDADDGESELIVIGTDAVNDFLAEKMLDGEIKALGIRYGTDDYLIRILKKDERRIVILAGGRVRSTIYAVYDFFETFASCHYFWDGDVIPKLEKLELPDEYDRVEVPRFFYRGLRYFAHRGLKRYQAEHWSFEDWKREMDWMLKKRLNMFMLRIGMDDIFQRVFPDDAAYPVVEKEALRDGFHDRRCFWPLEYRGVLRERIIKYATEHDIMHPEDCGTMTHWYSPTPVDFIEKRKPDFMEEANSYYSEHNNCCVWDIRKKENLDNYLKLTEGFVNEYHPGADLFHTIGLGERHIYDDRAKNHRMKLFTYRKIMQSLRERYPSSKLLVASWDFIGGRWTPEQVRELVGELDPERTVILDYTSDHDDPGDTYVNWGVINKFPWIFGIFHAYENESTMRGPYDRLAERIEKIKDDPMCKGLIIWPELSHSDTLMLEYFCENAWSPCENTVEELAERMSQRRYGELGGDMNGLWQTALPLIKTLDWGGHTTRAESDPEFDKYNATEWIRRGIWQKMVWLPDTIFNERRRRRCLAYELPRYIEQMPLCADILRAASLISEKALEDRFARRDIIDIVRMVIENVLDRIVAKVITSVDRGETAEQKYADQYMKLIKLYADFLEHNRDCSLYETLCELNKTCAVPPEFEYTLKDNFLNGYCKQASFEAVKYLYIAESENAFKCFMMPNEKRKAVSCEKMSAPLLKKFMDTPLYEMRPSEKPERALRDIISDMCALVETVDLSF